MHLGFQYIGCMASIHEQRMKQRALLEGLLEPRSCNSQDIKVLFVGVGDGRELELFLQSQTVRGEGIQFVALDIEDWLTPSLPILPQTDNLGSRLTFTQERAENMTSRFASDSFDIVQCGFLFHELPYGKSKDLVAEACFHVLKQGGSLIYSDMFLDNQPKEDYWREASRRNAVQALYNQYLIEADEALEKGRLTREEWQELRGDGSSPGLLHSRNEAVLGTDDFYERDPRCIERLLDTGFKSIEVHENCLNDFLRIIVARKPT